MTNPDIPVLIAGGGPTGLAAALLLARQGIPALLVERHAGTAIHPRARGLNARSMEILRGLGLEEAVRAAGAPLAASRYMLFVETLAGREIRRAGDDELIAPPARVASLSPTGYCQCAQDDLEPLLRDAALAQGADLRFDAELLSFSQDHAGVRATLLDRATAQRSAVRARYLIAADGAASPIRTALGIPSTGPGVLDHFVNIFFRADLSNLVCGREFGICFVESPAAPGILLSVNNRDRWLFNVSYAPDRGETAAAFTDACCVELVRAAVGLPGLDVEILSVLPWEAAALVAGTFRAGHVFLAGDAAHRMPPAGGFGLNTGIQDAHNLAWKLAAVLRGDAGEALLDSYDVERRPFAHLVVDQAVREVSAPRPDGPTWDLRDAPDDAADDGQPDQIALVLGYRYASVVILAADGMPPAPDGLRRPGTPGSRAPHLWVQRGAEHLSTLDLFGDHFVLLAGPGGPAWRAAADAAATALGVAVDRYLIGPDGDLGDPDNAWCAAYGVGPYGAVLVRPDGVVGWRCIDGPRDARHELTGALARLLARKAQAGEQAGAPA